MAPSSTHLADLSRCEEVKSHPSNGVTSIRLRAKVFPIVVHSVVFMRGTASTRTNVSRSSAALGLGLLAGCFNPSPNRAINEGTGGTDSECPEGEERCPCAEDRKCDGDLECRSDVCVEPDEGSSETSAQNEDEHSSGSGDSADASASEVSDDDSGTSTAETTTEIADDATSADAGATTSSDEGGESTTVETECTPFDSHSCADGCDGTRTCSAQGVWGACICDPESFCEPETLQCAGEQLQRCASDGDTWNSEGSECTGDFGCNVRAEGCAPSTVTTSNGWIRGPDNALGIQGPLRVSGVGLESSEEVWQDSMCMQGVSDTLDIYLPFGVAYFCWTEASETPSDEIFGLADCPYPRARELLGLQLTIEGDPLPSPLQVHFVELGQGPPGSAFIEAGLGTSTYLIADARDSDGNAANHDEIAGFALRAPISGAFSFCVTEMILLW